jgi:phosphatidylinositol glycan class O
VVDLDTNDKGVDEHIFEEMENPKTDIMFAHVLGVDHAGHSFDVNHSELKRKLEEIDDLLHRITERMDDNTTMIVFGDHGMVDEGNHGGSTDYDRATLLFAYSKGKEFEILKQKYPKMTEIPQTNIAATVTQMTNVKFPYSNIGVFQPELI